MVLGTFWGQYHDLVALVVTSAIALAALLVAWGQTRNGRLLDLHEKITTGDIGVARHKLAAHLYESGEGLADRIDWSEMQKLNAETCPTCNTSLDDAYAMLWFFQRLNRAVRPGVMGFATGLVPYQGARSMLDWHIVWWAIAFENVSVEDARFAADLQILALKIDPRGDVRVRALQHFSALRPSTPTPSEQTT